MPTPVDLQLTCRSCHFPLEERWQFCHNCGETILDAAPRPRPETKGPRWVTVAATCLGLAVAGIMAVTIYDFVQQYGLPGGGDASVRAADFLARGHEERAINLLDESLQLKPGDDRAADWRRMLDQALFDRGKRLAAEGKYRDAVTAFARISANFSKHEEVEKLISEYSSKGLPSVFGRGEEAEPTAEKSKLPLSRLEKAVMTAVPGGKEHVDPLPSSIRQLVPARGTSDQPIKP